MASNIHVGSTVSVTDKVFGFNRAVGYLNVFVATGTTLQLSFDGGDNFLTIPAGFNSMTIGPTTTVIATSTGAFQIVGVQT